MTNSVEAATADPIRDQLLDAAARVFAAKGYAGTKIQDIVREAGLSTGAVYGRFESKDELLRAAVVAQRSRFAVAIPDDLRVADLIKYLARLSTSELSDAEAVRLEAFMAARREPEVAAAVAGAQREWRKAVEPFVRAAMADGTVASDVDPEAVLFFVTTMHVGLLVQRAAGLAPPARAGWKDLVTRMVASFGDPQPSTDTAGDRKR